MNEAKRTIKAALVLGMMTIQGMAIQSIGCGGDNKSTSEPGNTATASATNGSTSQSTSTAQTTSSAVSASAAQTTQPPVELYKATPATPPEKMPTISFKAPAANQVIPADKVKDFEVKIDLTGWEIPAGGNHVHLIVDNRPYKRLDDLKNIKLGDLDPSYTLSEGEHVLVAFPSRSTHESVKPNAKAAPLAIVNFWVGKKGKSTFKVTEPMFIFSRPKGANDGPPPEGGILVDWYLNNAPLGPGQYSIDATLSGPGIDNAQKVSIEEWVPWRIRNPRNGEYTLHMVLVDKDKKPVPGAWNDTKRTFTVNTNAKADSHGHPAAK